MLVQMTVTAVVAVVVQLPAVGMIEIVVAEVWLLAVVTVVL